MGKKTRIWFAAAVVSLLFCQPASAYGSPFEPLQEPPHRSADRTLSSSSARPDLNDAPKIAYRTRGGYIAATDESLLERAILLALSKDSAAFAEFINTHPNVFPLKKGLEVFLERIVRPGKIVIRPKNLDISIWTVQEAIE